MSKILVGVKKPNEEIEFKEIEEGLESYYKEIGCNSIEVVYPLGNLEEEGIIIIGDEEGKLNRKECNFWLYDKQDCFNGTAIFVKDCDEDFGCLTEKDKEHIKRYLIENYMNPIERNALNNFIKERF